MSTDTAAAATGIGFHLMQPTASGAASHVDALFTVLVLLCGLVALVVCVLIVMFSVRYRRGAKVDRSHAPRNLLWLELTWTLLPLAIFVALFVWTATGFMRLYRPPEDALPVNVVAKQWLWKLQHRNGRREINELHVPLGQPVVLKMTSQDAIHSFYVPAFRLKQDVLPGRYTALWFTATQTGEFRLFCAEYCGTEHSQMVGRIVVMQPHEYGRWLASGPAEPSLAQYGFALFRQLGCSGCHGAQATVHAPLLEGLPGRQVHLQDGRTVVADDTYLRDAILTPRKDVVAGFAPVMPSYAGQASEEDIQALIAYLRDTPDTPATGASQ